MAIKKEYDEMTDVTRYFSPFVRMGGEGYFAKRIKVLAPTYVAIRVIIGISEGKVFSHLGFARRGYDWAWVGDTSAIMLVDGVRTLGEGVLVDSSTVTTDSKVYCDEIVSLETDLDFLKTMSNASNIKIRIGQQDIVPPQEFIPSLKEILDVTKDLGK